MKKKSSSAAEVLGTATLQILEFQESVFFRIRVRLVGDHGHLSTTGKAVKLS